MKYLKNSLILLAFFLFSSCVLKEKTQELRTIKVEETQSETHPFSEIKCKIDISSEAWNAENALENNKRIEEIALLEINKFPVENVELSQITFKSGKTDYRMIEARKSITFKTKTFEATAPLFSALRDKGIAFPKIEYEIDGEEEIWRALRSKCINSLKEKAAMTAAASGYKLGNALSLTECANKTTKNTDKNGNFTFQTEFEAVYEMKL